MLSVPLDDLAWPLVGREAQLSSFTRLLSRPASGGLVFAGPAGVGKTHLARACRQRADAAGVACVWVSATRSTSAMPFGAFAAHIPAEDTDTLAPAPQRPELLQRWAGALRARADGGRLVVFVDDAHLLDEMSAALVQQLAAAGDVFVVATLRSDEPVAEGVLALWKDGLATRIDLEGLAGTDIDALLDRLLDGDVDPAVGAALRARSAGNVLFLRELLSGALHDGSLRNDGGIWRLVHPLAPSARLSELVEARLTGLEPPARRLLELIAYAEPLGRAELHALSSPEAGEALERAGLIHSRLDGQRLELHLAHPVYGDVVRSRLTATRLQEIARARADVAEAGGARRREDTLRIAIWRLDGGGDINPHLMLIAAQTSRWRYDFTLAARLAGAAVRAGGGFEAQLLTAELANLQGRPHDARAQLEHLATTCTDDRQRLTVALMQVDTLAFALGRCQEALTTVEEHQTHLTDRQAWAELEAQRASLLLATRGPAHAAPVATHLVDTATGRARVWASMVAAWSLGRLGRIQAAHDATQQGRAEQDSMRDPIRWYPWFHEIEHLETLGAAGRFTDAHTAAAAGYDTGLAAGSAEAQGFFAWERSRNSAECGHVRQATRYAREAIALFRQVSLTLFLPNAYADLATALALSGHPDEARTVLTECDQLGIDEVRWVSVDRRIARAWTLVAAGDLPTAREVLLDAAQVGAETGDLVGRSAALHTLARCGYPEEALPDLTTLGEQLEGPLITARLDHVTALLHRSPDDLIQVSREFSAIGAHLLAAEAAADAAAISTRHNRKGTASTARRLSTAALAHCPDAQTPALRATAVRGELTPAELRTAAMVATGKSNKAVAQALQLSVRTVDNRLQRIYNKLGITTRTELAELLEHEKAGGNG